MFKECWFHVEAYITNCPNWTRRELVAKAYVARRVFDALLGKKRPHSNRACSRHGFPCQSAFLTIKPLLEQNVVRFLFTDPNDIY